MIMMIFHWYYDFIYIRYSASHSNYMLRSLISYVLGYALSFASIPTDCQLSWALSLYADLSHCPDDRALQWHIHSIPPHYTNRRLVLTINKLAKDSTRLGGKLFSLLRIASVKSSTICSL
jgi:hypothetical protein